jgi:hypothetical protein
VNDYRNPEDPPDDTVVFVDAAVEPILHDFAGEAKRRNAAAGEQYQYAAYQVDDTQYEYQSG